MFVEARYLLIFTLSPLGDFLRNHKDGGWAKVSIWKFTCGMLGATFVPQILTASKTVLSFLLIFLLSVLISSSFWAYLVFYFSFLCLLVSVFLYLSVTLSLCLSIFFAIVFLCLFIFLSLFIWHSRCPLLFIFACTHVCMYESLLDTVAQKANLFLSLFSLRVWQPGLSAGSYSLLGI